MLLRKMQKPRIFSSAVKNLKISEFSDTNPLAERLSDATLKAILKYKNHPSIVAIRNANKNPHFHFSEVSVEEDYKEIRKLVHVNLPKVLIFLSECLRRKLTFLLIIFFNVRIKNLHFHHPF